MEVPDRGAWLKTSIADSLFKIQISPAMQQTPKFPAQYRTTQPIKVKGFERRCKRTRQHCRERGSTKERRCRLTREVLAVLIPGCSGRE